MPATLLGVFVGAQQRLGGPGGLLERELLLVLEPGELSQCLV